MNETGKHFRGWVAVVAIAGLYLARPARADDADAARRDFFEKKIRPVLVQHCYECHSGESKKLEGGLRLDSRPATRMGGDTGPALVARKPAESLILRALRYDGPEMPPKGKLPANIIADFEAWIRDGAVDPRDEAPAASKQKPIDFTAARLHWAYQPIRKPALPAIKNSGWPTTPIDHFVLAELERRGLSPSPAADPATLLRRVSIDLIGLPPTPQELADFQQSAIRNPQSAFAEVVERLLASPHYGERWGRHWLDVARYADTKDGVLMFGADRMRPYAYTYRDYVVRALNEDTPYDRFVQEQLASDQIEPAVAPWRLGAMGFLTLGRMYDNNPPDIHDDRIDTVTRGLLGLTVACARCHDHKYDAIPTDDYYSLYGVFASSEAPLELPLTAEVAQTPEVAEFEKQAAPKREQLQKHLDSQYAQITETARLRVGDYLMRIAVEKPDPLENAVYYLSLSPDDLRPQITARWRRYLAQHAGSADPVFGPWHELLQLPADEFEARAHEILLTLKTTSPSGAAAQSVNPLLLEALAASPPKSKADVVRIYGDLFKRVYQESKSAEAPQEAARRQLLEMLVGGDSPTHLPKNQAYLYMSRVERDTFNKLQNELDKLAVNSPHAPPRAMALVDAAELYDPRIFVRGNPTQHGQRVPRQFPRILGGDARQPFANGSGRLDLARAITSPDNPLTSRVLVNRIWMHHLGEPLVATPSDFGTRSTPPSHPALLDWLAAELMTPSAPEALRSASRLDDNPQSAIRIPQSAPWSLKHLHRLIVHSSTYRQASGDRPECRNIDPENRWLWRAHRRRLDLEAMRDSLLAISGRLDRAVGGRPVDIAGDPGNRRRTIYGLVDRQDLPGLFRSFDFASPDQTAERRTQTTVPQQALFGLNSPFVLEQARSLASRDEIAGQATPAARIAALYRTVLLREPDALETESALRFIEAASSETAATPSKLTPWQQLAQVLLLTNEMMFVD